MEEKNLSYRRFPELAQAVVGVTMEQRAEDSWSTLQGEVKMRTL